MACTPFSANGATGFICGPGPKRCGCGNRSVFLCDWKVPERKSGTCDADLCGACATSPEKDKHLCPAHRTAWAEWRKAKRAANPPPPAPAPGA